MISPRNLPPSIVAIALAASALAACNEAEPTIGTFERTGELVALSGGDSGARGACITCHGLDGGGDGNLVPRLARLNRGYIVRQLEYFSIGQRRHPQMMWIADHLDWPSRQRVAEYYSGLPIPPAAEANDLTPAACDPAIARLYHEGDADRGLPSCESCHGAEGAGVGQGNPPLANQPFPYLAAQLFHWRNGERYGDPHGAMTLVSQLLLAEEIEPLARYSAHLSGSIAYPEPPAACLRIRRPDPRSGV